jgi:FixJ family two-component response regulator
MVSAKRQTVFIVDEESVCDSVRCLLRDQDVQVISFGRADACLRHLSLCQCHLLIAEINMPKMHGMAFLKQVKLMTPWLPVMMVTGAGDVPMAVESIKLGASDFVEKPLERIVFTASVKKLLKESNHTHERLGQALTRTERRILPFIVAGQSSREIAEKLFRSVRTIELHRQHIMSKMGVNNTVALVHRVHSMGLGRTELPKEKGV